MADNEEIQARITAIRDRINRRKQNQQHPQSHAPQQHLGYEHPRWAPYGRGGRVAYQNRTLVVNSANAGQRPATDAPLGLEDFVSTRGTTNKQLMTKDTYEREQKHKIQIKEQQRVARRQKRSTEEQSRILRHVDTAGPSSRELAVDGVSFRLTDDGSKLIRVSGTCPFGPQCRFAHDPNKVAICKDFQKQGSCSRGDNCDITMRKAAERQAKMASDDASDISSEEELQGDVEDVDSDIDIIMGDDTSHELTQQRDFVGFH
ncbi:hypothetical protein LTR08_003804 [Meristemomyces frigidus]|nr:hypothetical protein LTR08_003804 [Meristemomyces frigidus]